MAAAVQPRQGDDIDRFITDQRQKLQQERRTVNDGETERGRRRQWDKSGNNQYAEQVDTNEDENENAFSKRCGTPELSLKLGQYEKVRLRLNAERQQEYNDLQKKGTNVGKQNSQSPRDLYDYDVVNKEMMENKRLAYLDYLQKGQPGAPSGRLTWDQTGQTQLPAQQGQKGKKHTVNYEEWEKGFQDDKRTDYNKYLKTRQNQGRLLKKEPTPPLEGMKFGEFEEYKRETEPDRRRQYKEDLEKQKREQALIKLKRDYPNKQPLINPTPREERKQYRSGIEQSKQKQFSKMLAQQPSVRDVRHQDTQPRRRSPSPEFSDPGMQLQADRIRARIRDLPTRPEEVEELQRRQQQQDTLQRELQDVSPRNSYEDRPPPLDLSPRLDDYGPGPSDRYPPPQEDYRQPPQGQGSRPQPQSENRHQKRRNDGVQKHVELQRHLEEEERKRRQAEHDEDENIRKQLEVVKRRQELEEKRKIKQKLEADTRRQLEEERRKKTEQDQAEKEIRRQIAEREKRTEEEKRLLQVKHQEGVRRQIVEKNRQEAEEKKRRRKDQQQDEGMLKQLEKGRQREAEDKRRRQEFEEEQDRQLAESKRLLEEGRPSTVHVRFEDDEEAVLRRRRPYSEHTPGYDDERSRRTKTSVERPGDKNVIEEGVSLPISSHKQRQKQLTEERNQEYNAILAQENKKNRTSHKFSGEGVSLHVSSHKQRKQRLEEERNKEYNEMIAQETNPKRNKSDMTGEGVSLRISSSSRKQRRKQLEDDRKREYNEMVAKDTKQAGKKADLTGEGVSLRISDSSHKQKRKQLEDDRKREYNEMVAQDTKQASKKAVISGEGVSLRISDSSHKQKRKQLEDDRKREYNEMVAQDTKQASKKAVISGEGVSLCISDSSHKQRKKQLEDDRKREYNEMVAQRNGPPKKKDVDDLVGEGISLQLSGHEGQRQQLKDAVKREYNDMLTQQGTNMLDKDKSALQGEAISLPLSAHKEKRRQMIKERQEEYKALLAQKKFQGQPKKRFNLDGEDKSLALSDHTDQRKKLAQERTHDNVAMVSKKKSDKSGRNPLEGEAISLPISGHEKERQRLMEERRREYNEIISQLKSKKPNRKGTETTFVPEELDTSDNEILSDSKHRDFTQQYDSDEGRETTALNRKQQHQPYRKLEPDPYPRELARPELLASLPQGQYEVERERVDFDRQRQNEEMLSKNDVVERMRFINQLEENRIFLNRMHNPWRDNPIRQTLADAVRVHTVSTLSPGEGEGNVTPVDDEEEEEKEEEQKQNTGRRLKREKNDGRPSTPGGLMNKMGLEQQSRTNKLNNERKKEYNQLLTEQAEAIRDMTKSYAEVLESERSERGGKPRRPSSEKSTRNKEDPRPARGRPPRPDYNSTPPRTQARFDDPQPESFSGGPPGPSAMDTEQDQLNLSFESPRSWSMEWFERPKDYDDVKPYSMRKRAERNDEYNEFMRNKEENQRAKSADRRPPLPRERPASRHGRNSPSQQEIPRLDLEGGAQPPTPRRKPIAKQPENFEASLPGLQRNSAQRRRKEEERNREYNEMLKMQKGRGRGRGTPRDVPPETRRGWQTPTYDEILEKKRREERQYRRQEGPYGDNRGMRPYASEGAINRVGVDDIKMRDLDRDYEQRRVRFQNDRSKERGGILDDDNWLRTDAAKEQQYSKLVKKISGPKPKDYLDSKSDSELEENFRYKKYRQRDREDREEAPNPRQKDMSRPAGDFFATLPLGEQNRDSATRRKKQKYRDELQLQMQDKKAAKFREKNEDMMVAASGFLDPEKTPVRVKSLGQPGLSPRRRARSPEVTAYHSRIVQKQQGQQGGNYDPSGDFGLGGGVSFGVDASAPKGRRRERAGYEPSAFLDGGGFDTGLLEPRRPTGLSLPPGLQYQPTTYITGQDSLGGINSHTSIDDAYRFYGMRNPLDPEPNGGGGNQGVPPLNLGGEGQLARGRSPRVTFDDSQRGILKDSARRQTRHSRSPGRTTPYQFDADQQDRGTTNMNKREYANDLARQMELDKMKRERAKQENMRYEKKIEEDMLNYNPFGRSGGGAPNTDAKGVPIADLRQMRKRVDDPSYTPPPRESPRFRAPISPRDIRDDLIPPPPAQINAEGESTYALGGHGIFGNPRTEEEKSKADKYKDDLRLQILEKKRQDQLKKEQEKIEEEKENRRLEEQRQRIQRDFDEEQRKKREKEEENRRKQEELIRKNEEKRREAERAKREKAEIRQRDRERELDEQNRYESQHRTSSPPVPTLRSKLATTDGEPEQEVSLPTIVVPPSHPPSRPVSRPESQTSSGFHAHYRAESSFFSPKPPPSAKRPVVAKGEDGDDARTPRTDSPPVPARRTQQEPQPQSKARPPPEPLQRANSSEVLRELANMRQQLESERKRVEGALNKQKNEPEVFDPRLVQRPPPKEVDVFERATQGNASVPQRVSDNANPRNIAEFQDLKYKAPEEPAAPRAPVAPTSEASTGDTESRRAFRSMFPEQPYTNTTLESQQDAMLRQQNEQIRTLKDRSYVPPNDLGMSARQGTGTPRSLLQANTAFIDVENINHFPEDFDDMAPKRNDSAARMRRRDRVTPLHDLAGPSNVMGSVSSLDVDRLQRKNDARMRRLQQMNADEVSMADPDEILENFMAKQRYNRPPSGQTLQDDTWLQPGSKQL